MLITVVKTHGNTDSIIIGAFSCENDMFYRCQIYHIILHNRCICHFIVKEYQGASWGPARGADKLWSLDIMDFHERPASWRLWISMTSIADFHDKYHRFPWQVLRIFHYKYHSCLLTYRGFLPYYYHFCKRLIGGVAMGYCDTTPYSHDRTLNFPISQNSSTTFLSLQCLFSQPP